MCHHLKAPGGDAHRGVRWLANGLRPARNGIPKVNCTRLGPSWLGGPRNLGAIGGGVSQSSWLISGKTRSFAAPTPTPAMQIEDPTEWSRLISDWMWGYHVDDPLFRSGLAVKVSEPVPEWLMMNPDHAPAICPVDAKIHVPVRRRIRAHDEHPPTVRSGTLHYERERRCRVCGMRLNVDHRYMALSFRRHVAARSRIHLEPSVVGYCMLSKHVQSRHIVWARRCLRTRRNVVKANSPPVVCSIASPIGAFSRATAVQWNQPKLPPGMRLYPRQRDEYGPGVWLGRDAVRRNAQLNGRSRKPRLQRRPVRSGRPVVSSHRWQASVRQPGR